MKAKIKVILTAFIGLLILACSPEEDVELDSRLPVKQPIDPSTQPNELNKELIIYGELEEGNMPSAKIRIK